VLLPAQGQIQFDKLGVTGSSPVTPILGGRSVLTGLSSFWTLVG
jgi:hypothetical protein